MLEIRQARIGRGVFTTAACQTGDMIFFESGKLNSVRTRHSIQVDEELHVSTSLIQYFNHSCEPNCGLAIRRGDPTLEVYAIQPIAAEAELTLDYATFEKCDLVLSAVACDCQTKACRGRITGFESLPSDRREALRDYIAEYLQ